MKRIKDMRDSEWLREIVRDAVVTEPDKERLLKIADKLEESEPPPPPELTRKGIIAIRDNGMEDDEGRRVIHKAAMDELCGGALALLDQAEELEQASEQTIAQRLDLIGGKYTRRMAALSDSQIHGLLWLIGEFAARSSVDEFFREPIKGHRRRNTALKAIIDFTKNPMTFEETLAYIRAAMRAHS